MTTFDPASPAPGGGAFLIHDATPESCFFPEDFSDEHRQIARTTAEFAANEVLPRSAAIEAKDFDLTRRLIRHAASLGLTAADIPEQYGGLELDKISSAIIAENISPQGSFSVSFSAHTGIGTLPLVWYGTPEQKARYLPHLADGSFVAAYALSESSSGSDALAASTRAVLSADGQTYTLDGEKMWITNGGFADLYTVFARCRIPESAEAGPDAGKERLTAFLIEKGTPGFRPGPEEHKLGIRGSSTTPLILTGCVIPAANLLGQVGKGHHIAFNILNVGRYKLGNAAVGAARHTFHHALRYAQDRKAFGKSIASFGLIQQKLARMATGIFVGEALCYRTVGLIDAALQPIPPADTPAIQRAIESYAVECSVVKVWASEMLDSVVDDTVQIFGGYGYVEDYPAERAYRDSRVNRIFEGTNEINRLIITGWLIKSAASGKLPLMPAIRAVMDDVLAGPTPPSGREGPLAHSFDLLAALKKTTLFAAGAATQRYNQQLAEQQEVMAALADCIIALFTLESALLRAQKILTRSRATPAPILPAIYCALYAAQAVAAVELSARAVLAASAEGDAAATHFAILRRLLKHQPADTIALTRQLAGHLLRTGRYSPS